MQGKRIKGIVFDLDGTLYSLGGRRLRMTLVLWKDIKVLRHLTGTRSWLRGRSFEGPEAFSKAFCEELGRRAGLTPEQARVWYQDRFLSNFVKMLAGKARVRPGLVDLLKRLREQGVKLAVVSDYGYVRERLRALGIPEKMFDDEQSAEDHGVLKPSARPLKALAEKWGVEPEAVVVVGDRLDLDAMSAEAAGMEFIGITEKARSSADVRGFVSWPEAVRMLENKTGVVDSHELVGA